jgi:hypothetical protein
MRRRSTPDRGGGQAAVSQFGLQDRNGSYGGHCGHSESSPIGEPTNPVQQFRRQFLRRFAISLQFDDASTAESRNLARLS